LLGRYQSSSYRTRKPSNKRNYKTSKWTKEKETRATFIVNEDLEKMKSLAYWDGVLIKDIVNTAFEDYITLRKKNGEIKRCLKIM
jgi:hypothetical protein